MGAGTEHIEKSAERFFAIAEPALGSRAADSSASGSQTAGLRPAALVSDSWAADSHIAVEMAADSPASDSHWIDSPASDSLASAERKPAQESACFAGLLAVRCSESLEVAALERPAFAAFAALLALVSSASECFAADSLKHSLPGETQRRLFAFPLPDWLATVVERAEEASDNTMTAMKPTECFHLQSPIQECLDSTEPKCGASPGHTPEDSGLLGSAEYLVR